MAKPTFAAAPEHADDGMNAGAVARALGIARSTVYTIDWLRQRAYRATPTGGMRWDRRDIELFKVLHRVASDAPMHAPGRAA